MTSQANGFTAGEPCVILADCRPSASRPGRRPMTHNFRDIVPKPDNPRIAGLSGRNACQHVEQRMEIPRVRDFMAAWKQRAVEPFHGITTDGHRIGELFHLADEGAPTGQMVAAARNLLAIATDEERSR